MYLIKELPIRYDLNLFEFILNLMEVICLVPEGMRCSVGWLKLTVRISSNNKCIEIGNNMLVKHFRSRAIMGYWYPTVSIDFHGHAMNGMMCEASICLSFCIFQCEEALPWDGLPRMGVSTDLGR